MIVFTRVVFPVLFFRAVVTLLLVFGCFITLLIPGGLISLLTFPVVAFVFTIFPGGRVFCMPGNLFRSGRSDNGGEVGSGDQHGLSCDDIHDIIGSILCIAVPLSLLEDEAAQTPLVHAEKIGSSDAADGRNGMNLEFALFPEAEEIAAFLNDVFNLSSEKIENTALLSLLHSVITNLYAAFLCNTEDTLIDKDYFSLCITLGSNDISHGDLISRVDRSGRGTVTCQVNSSRHFTECPDRCGVNCQ